MMTKRLSDILSRDYCERVTVSSFCDEYRATFSTGQAAESFAARFNGLKRRAGGVVILKHSTVRQLETQG